MVAVPVPRAETKIAVIAVAALAVIGISTITLFAPTLVSVNVVEVAFAVSVIDPVLLDFAINKITDDGCRCPRVSSTRRDARIKI